MRKKSFTKPLGVVLDEELFNQLSELTDRKEISKSEFIRNLIKAYFHSKSKQEQNAERHDRGGNHHG
jgi:metal-responsive CopG/Arc/MetJ family transcriptional regulator